MKTHCRIGKVRYKARNITVFKTPDVSRREVPVMHSGKVWARVIIENYYVGPEEPLHRDTAVYILECAKDALIYDD